MRSELNIETVCRGGKTYAGKTYCNQPFKLADLREDKTDKTLKLAVMSSSPGLLDGDAHFWKINLGENCSLELTTQSYQRLFTMERGASQSIEARLAAGSSFTYLPYPVVPHKKSIFTSTNKIYLSSDCNLLWSEIITAGRNTDGEVFQFSQFHSVTEIFLHNKLVLKENLLINPVLSNVNMIGQYEGYTHQATCFWINENIEEEKIIKETIAFLSNESCIIFGVSRTPINGLLVRIAGFKAEQLLNCVRFLTENIFLHRQQKAYAE